MTFKFSMLPEFEDRLDGFHVWNATVELGRTFGDKRIATHWIDIPPLITSNHLTAAMLMEVYSDLNSGGRFIALIACSINACWACGTNISTLLPEIDNMIISRSLALIREKGSNVGFLLIPGPN